MPSEGEILIRIPGSSAVIDYASQAERDRSLRLAEARQELAHGGVGYVPPWAELTEAEREKSALEARNWLRAAVACGLIPGGGR
jgi:hypothetical protein